MKSDMGGRYRARILANIIYSAIISCLVELFLVANISMIARYMEGIGRTNALTRAILDQSVAAVMVCLVLGLVLCEVTFMIL